MDVQVFGQRELDSRLRHGKPVHSHLISIGNPATRHEHDEDTQLPESVRHAFTSILRLTFYDVEEKHHLPPDKPKRIPRKRDVRKVIRYVKRTRDEASGYTIHCWRGISRSTAVALGVLYMLRGDEQAAATELAGIRRHAMPLARIVGYFDSVLGSNLADQAETLRQAQLAELRKELMKAAFPDQDDDALDELPSAE
jgi:predicted protein tyrosine phosphatase